MTDRNALIDGMRRYLDRMLAHDPAGLEVAGDLKLTENGEPVVLGGGLFQSVRAIGFRQYFTDVTTQQVGFFGTLETVEGPRIVALRLAFDRGMVRESEAIVARPGGHMLFAPQALIAPLPIYEQRLDADERRPRAELIRIADLYFDALEQTDGSIAPFHPACNRRENGVLTTNNPAHKALSVGCRESIAHFKHIERVRERRYPIVDEERGLVLGLVMFDMPSQDRSLRLAELFKIANGEIREIEAVLINTPLGASAGWQD